MCVNISGKEKQSGGVLRADYERRCHADFVTSSAKTAHAFLHPSFQTSPDRPARHSAG